MSAGTLSLIKERRQPFDPAVLDIRAAAERTLLRGRLRPGSVGFHVARLREFRMELGPLIGREHAVDLLLHRQAVGVPGLRIGAFARRPRALHDAGNLLPLRGREPEPTHRVEVGIMAAVVLGLRLLLRLRRGRRGSGVTRVGEGLR
jgi:hypothetical protein